MQQLCWTVENRNLQCINIVFLVFILIWPTWELTSFLDVASEVLIVSLKEISWGCCRKNCSKFCPARQLFFATSGYNYADLPISGRTLD